ncbi:MAG: hypothetical protein ABSE73_09610, partial [Planctomycetota bacterium]
HSQTFLQPLGTETVLLLTPEEVKLKPQALAAYLSAQSDLGYVSTAQESFRPLCTYAYDSPPHAGKLFYQRFQWVFFRHPRIDFTQPQEACRDFANFRKALRDST